MNRSNHIPRFPDARAIVALLFLSSSTMLAQDAGLPTLDTETITVVGKRVIVLPAARKGEVLDTSLHYLPAGDTLLFGERVSNLGGPGGILPGYRELASPLMVDAELSVGSYISPRASIHGEYIRPEYDAAGTIDYRGTEGHIDSASASSLLFALQGGLAITGDELVPKSRLSAAIEHLGEGYFLYGNRLTPFDRSRRALRVDLGLQSQEERAIDYELGVRFASTGVDDKLRDSTFTASALSPSFRFGVEGAIDSSLRAHVQVDYATTSLRYASATRTPATVRLAGDVEWQPAAKLHTTVGVFFGSGQNSDSGSTSLIMPRISLRYDLDENISLFGWLSPELRAPSYRDRLMQAPYVDREITLRPEAVPIGLVAGARYVGEALTTEGRFFFESASNTPVVTADSNGRLHYVHVDSRSIGVSASARMELSSDLSIDGELLLRSSTEDSSGGSLPMRPSVDVRFHGDYHVSDRLGLFGTLQMLSGQVTSLAADAPTLGMYVLLGLGGRYRFEERIEAFVELTNLLNQSYDRWQNYSAPGIEARGGVRVRL